MTTNNNTVYIESIEKSIYKVGDVFKVPERCHDWRLQAFDGLEIKGIVYQFGTWLHFDFYQWLKNRKKIKISNGNKSRRYSSTHFIKSIL